MTFHPISVADLAACPEPTWIWQGYLAPGSITLLCSPGKSGKTTLVSHLLSRRRAGGTLLDLSVTAGVTAVVSEESAADWHDRHRRLGLGDNVCLFCRPFPSRPLPDEYVRMLDQFLRLKEERGLDLVVFDPLAECWPARENDPPALLQSLHLIRRLTEAGISFLLLHHTRKARSKPGMPPAAPAS